MQNTVILLYIYANHYLQEKNIIVVPKILHKIENNLCQNLYFV